MAEAARKKGYEYLGITDHSKRVTMAHGLDAERLARRNEQIDELNEKYKDFVVLKGIEVDILKDGALDLPDEILKELDFTVCSVHYNTNLSREKQTERIIRAMGNPYFSILGHPSGRLINEREAYDVDLEQVLEAARKRGCFVELNAHPDRLDLTDTYCKTAKELGVKVVISTDAHRTSDLDFMRFGIYQGKRGWLERDDVLNTRGLGELRKSLRRRMSNIE
jgi:DNA polymerase (family X)